MDVQPASRQVTPTPGRTGGENVWRYIMRNWYFQTTYRSIIFYSFNEKTRKAIFLTIEKMVGYELKLTDSHDCLMCEFYLDFQSMQERRLQIKEITEAFFEALKVLGED